jgi:hypothetical protein
MNIDPANLRKSARSVADAGAIAENAADVADGSHSTLGRVGLAVSAVKLGARLLPVAIRLARRYPLGAVLVIGGAAAWMLYSSRSAGRTRLM